MTNTNKYTKRTTWDTRVPEIIVTDRKLQFILGDVFLFSEKQGLKGLRYSTFSPKTNVWLKNKF